MNHLGAAFLIGMAGLASSARAARGSEAAAHPGAGVSADAPAQLSSEAEAGGTHLRILTAAGPVHVFRPARYDRRSAGVVVYVHGYYVDVDAAWRDHKLAEQFARSRRNALFVAPEAPGGPTDKPGWPHLRKMLASIFRRARLDPPRGPLVVAGHSAAYRSIVPWLAEPSLRHIILIDALYGNERDFRAWVKKTPAHHLTLAIRGTAKWADPFLRSLPFAVTLPRIPDRFEQFTRPQRTARVLALRSQFGHFELITEGKVIPVLLARAPLPLIRRIPPHPMAAEIKDAAGVD